MKETVMIQDTVLVALFDGVLSVGIQLSPGRCNH